MKPWRFVRHAQPTADTRRRRGWRRVRPRRELPDILMSTVINTPADEGGMLRRTRGRDSA